MMNTIAHANPTRGKQAKTAKERRVDSGIIIAALGVLERRRKEAENAGDFAALRALVFDYRAIKCPRWANEINNDLPAAYKIPPATLLAVMDL